MNERWHFLLVILLVASRPTRADPVDTLITTAMNEHHIPGVALTVLQADTSVKTAVYGQANLELRVPVQPETVFEIGSITKQFTAAAILLLAQDHKLSVEDKISVYFGSAPPAWRGITIRHLLTHTSGIKNYTGLDGFELRR